MKSNNSSPSNSKSEDTPCKCACHENKLKKLYGHDTACCNDMNGWIEPPQDGPLGQVTSLDDETLRQDFVDRMWNYFGIEDRDELAHFAVIFDKVVLPLFAEYRAKLFEQIRSEVIGDDEPAPDVIQRVVDNQVVYDQLDDLLRPGRNNLRVKQREALTRLEGTDE